MGVETAAPARWSRLRRAMVTRARPSRRLTVVVVGVSALATVGIVTSTSAIQDATETTDGAASPPVDEPTPGGRAGDRRLVWSDEFDGDEVDTDVWSIYHSTYGHGNNELQCHTPDNVAVSEGVLTITARREERRCPQGARRSFTSGFLGTRETRTFFPRFGRYEIRAKVPHAQGLWPAFWLRHRDGAAVAEVDVMEYFHAQVPGRSTSTVHLDGERNVSKVNTHFESPTTEPGWHTWAVEIEEAGDGASFTFLLDGTVVHEFVDEQAAWVSAHEGRPLWDIAVNLAVGGDWVGHPDDPLGFLRGRGACAAGGDPPDDCNDLAVREATFPETLVVDHVRVYETR